MRTPLAWLNLVENKTRTGVATAGVAFAVVLIFMQLGFLGAAQRSATLVYDSLDFDVLIRSPRYLHLLKARDFPRARLHGAASVEGVAKVRPFYAAASVWRCPEHSATAGRRRAILTIGVRPDDPPFLVDEIQRQAPLLGTPQFALIGSRSRPEFGPRNGICFGDADLGVVTEVGRGPVEIRGHFALDTGFVADGSLILSDEGFCRIQGRSPDDVTLGLLKVTPGSDPAAVARALSEQLPEDVVVLTREEVNRFEVNRWVKNTSIGIIFQLGVAVALMVGTAIVYQVLYSDVANRLAEYATLKAMGYGGGYLAKVVLQQAAALALLGFVPGLLIAEILYRITGAAARLPMQTTWPQIAFVLILSVVMCMVSGLGALRKVRAADPADLF